MSQNRALDRTALWVVGLCLAAVVASLFGRAHLLRQNDTGLKALARDASGHGWFATQRHLIIADASGELRSQASLEEAGVTGIPSDMARVGDELWLLTTEGAFHACVSTPAPRCRGVDMPVHPAHGSLLWLPARGEVALVDRTHGQLHTVLLSSRVLTASAGAAAGLVRPGKPTLTDTHLALPNTGASHLVGWKLPELPHLALILGEPPERLLATQGQPSFAHRAADGSWLVLEAGTTLAQGGVARYAEGGARKPLGLRLKDPMALTEADNGQVWVAGLRDRDTVVLDADGNERSFLAASTQNVLNRIERTSVRGQALARYAVTAAVVFLLLPFGVLWGMGYGWKRSVNARDARKDAPLPATTGFSATVDLGAGMVPMPDPVVPLNKAQVRRSRLWLVLGMVLVFLGAGATSAFLLHDLRAALLALIPVLAAGVGYRLFLRHLDGEPDGLVFVVEGLMVIYGDRRTLLPYAAMHVCIEGERRLSTRLNNRPFVVGRGALFSAKALDVPRLIALVRILVPAPNISRSGWRYWVAALRRHERWAQQQLLGVAAGVVVVGWVLFGPVPWR